MQGPVQTIPQAFSRLKNQGFIRQLDAAQRLNLSEGELIAAHINQDTFWRALSQPDVSGVDLTGTPPKSESAEISAVEDLSALRLRPDWHALMGLLEPIGEVMALTRNASCVHEKIGIYQNATLTERVGVMASANIDLRAFYAKWTHGFAVSEMTTRGRQHSFQFFDMSASPFIKFSCAKTVMSKPIKDSRSTLQMAHNKPVFTPKILYLSHPSNPTSKSMFRLCIKLGPLYVIHTIFLHY